LQRYPLQSDAAAKRDDGNEATSNTKHFAEPSNAPPVRQTAEIGQANLGG